AIVGLLASDGSDLPLLPLSGELLHCSPGVRQSSEPQQARKANTALYRRGGKDFATRNEEHGARAEFAAGLTASVVRVFETCTRHPKGWGGEEERREADACGAGGPFRHRGV